MVTRCPRFWLPVQKKNYLSPFCFWRHVRFSVRLLTQLEMSPFSGIMFPVLIYIMYQNILLPLSVLCILKQAEPCVLYHGYTCDLYSKITRVKICLVFSEVWFIKCLDSSLHLPNGSYWVERPTGPRWRPHGSSALVGASGRCGVYSLVYGLDGQVC